MHKLIIFFTIIVKRINSAVHSPIWKTESSLVRQEISHFRRTRKLIIVIKKPAHGHSPELNK
jgi:hypothetical protein